MKKKEIFSDIPNAVFVIKDTSSLSYKINCYTWPAKYGIKKVKGCVEFFPAIGHEDKLILNDVSDERYGDHPAEEEAYLVYPMKGKKGKEGWYWWEPVHDKLQLLKS